MPYNKRKQKCKQSDGTSGNYVLSYTTKKGEKRSACHTSQKKMQGQIAAIEAEADESEEEVLEEIRDYINLLLKEEMLAERGTGDPALAEAERQIVDSVVNWVDMYRLKMGMDPNDFRDDKRVRSALDDIIGALIE